MLPDTTPLDEADVVAKLSPTLSSEYWVWRKLSFQTTDPLPAISPPSTPGVADFARKPLMLSALLNRSSRRRRRPRCDPSARRWTAATGRAPASELPRTWRRALSTVEVSSARPSVDC